MGQHARNVLDGGRKDVSHGGETGGKVWERDRNRSGIEGRGSGRQGRFGGQGGRSLEPEIGCRQEKLRPGRGHAALKSAHSHSLGPEETAKTGRKWHPQAYPSVVRPAGTIQAVPLGMPRRARSWQVSVDMARKIGIVCGTAPAIAAVCQGTFRLLPFSPPHE